MRAWVAFALLILTVGQARAQNATLPAYFSESWATVAAAPFRTTFAPPAADETGAIAPPRAAAPASAATIPLPPRRPVIPQMDAGPARQPGAVAAQSLY
jgi:hypothetical protein